MLMALSLHADGPIEEPIDGPIHCMLMAPRGMLMAPRCMLMAPHCLLMAPRGILSPL